MKFDENTCILCKYYCQHYVRVKDAYEPVCSGHCMNSKIKECQPELPACAAFEKKSETVNQREDPSYTVRFTTALYEEIQKTAKQENLSFAHLVLDCCKYTLDHMENKGD